MTKANRVKWDGEGGVADNARRELPPIVREYFAAVRAFLAHKIAPPRLHELRLASKRLRYTLELFRDCYPAGLEDRLEALKALQDRLGEVNDAVASGLLLRDALKGQPKLRKFLKDRAAQQAAEFVRHWKESFDAAGQEAWWTEFLAEKARTPRAAGRGRPVRARGPAPPEP